MVRGLVDLVDVGALFAVDFDVHEQRVHDRRGLRILERLVSHDVAPMAGGIANRQQNRLVLFACKLERFFAPRVPVHRILRVLLQVGAGFPSEAVRHFSYRSFTDSSSKNTDGIEILAKRVCAS